MKLKLNLIKVGLASTALVSLLLSACGPVVNTQQGATQIFKLKAIGITEITGNSSTNARVGLSWEGLPNNTQTLSLFRLEEGQASEEIKPVGKISDLQKNVFTDTSSDELIPGKSYIYSMRADGPGTLRGVGTAESFPVKILDPGNMEPPSLTQPSADGRTLLDPQGFGAEFTWQNNGSQLYYAVVTNSAGEIQWAAITDKNKINSSFNSTESVPPTLWDVLPISKPNPDPLKGEVQFKPLTEGTYNVEIKALKTEPVGVNLNNATALAIRSTGKRSFNFSPL